jgi:hypothetical protein
VSVMQVNKPRSPSTGLGNSDALFTWPFQVYVQVRVLA